INFGTAPGNVSTLAGLQTALAGLVGGTASVDPGTGNISVAALNNTPADTITVGGTASLATFGIPSALALPTAGTRVSLSEDAVGSAFGFKLAGATGTLTNANILGPSGSPPAITVDFATNPNPGDILTVTFNLPDGTKQDMTLTATTASPPGVNAFTIGATPAATAANLQTAMTTAVKTLAGTQLTAASAVEAAHKFFDVHAGQPPPRGLGPSPTTPPPPTHRTAPQTGTPHTRP